MTNIKLTMLAQMGADKDVQAMCATVCMAEGATSIAHLFDINRFAFDELYEACEDLLTQLPESDI